MDPGATHLHPIEKGHEVFILGIILIVVALFVDLASFALGVRRLRGDGPSGVPIIGLLAFAGGALAIYKSGSIGWDQAITYAKWYILVHIMLQFGLLFMVDVLLRILHREPE